MFRTFTTPLYYVNAVPHLGHFYTTFLADVLKRHYRQRNDQVFFLTGTDEHGQKVADVAKKQGKSEKVFVNEIADQFKSTWDQCGFDYDRFYRTTEPNHIKQVQHALQILKDRGEIEFREYEGLYDVGSERFVKESELTADGLCADTMTKPELRKEGNYFFLMSKYQQQMIQLFESKPNLIQPDQYRNEMLAFLKNQPLEDLCISRPKSRLEWGIELPFDPNFVTYVWFDALLNYAVAAGWPTEQNSDQWNSTVHLIAKDIVKAHGIYWTAILLALKINPYQQLRVHGYWLIQDQKMSKTIGNVVRPLDIQARFGLEPLRYYLMREMSFGQDAAFSFDGFIQTANAALANGIGNLTSRMLTLCVKNQVQQMDLKQLTDGDRAFLDKRKAALQAWNEGFENLKFQNSVKAWSELVTACDLYINENKPWALAKDPAQKERLSVVLICAANVLRALAIIGNPLLPVASRSILEALGQPSLDLSNVEVTEAAFNFSPEVPRLFPRLELPVEAEAKK
jgi:methionyl-tRNA synthetase